MAFQHKLEIIPLEEWGFTAHHSPCVIAGPCSAESREQVLSTASGLKAIGIDIFRAGIWKPRTHPGSFEGVGSSGLDWLSEVKETLGMKIATEVASAKHVQECIEHGFDLLWIGARTTTSPFLVQEIAEALKGSDIPVLVKNPVNPDMDLWIGALERLNNCGIKKLGVILRGFSTFEKIAYRNDPQWQYAIELRSRYMELPFFCDPSHLGGKREYVGEISQRAMDLGLDGLMIEAHICPECALSDAAQQLSIPEIDDLLTKRLQTRQTDCDAPSWKDNIDQLRAQIDILDENIINILSQRMRISRKIGEYKKDNNVAILQTGRWDAVLAEAIRKGTGLGLDEDFIRTVFTAIHNASVNAQK